VSSAEQKILAEFWLIFPSIYTCTSSRHETW